MRQQKNNDRRFGIFSILLIKQVEWLWVSIGFSQSIKDLHQLFH